jgi:two-component system, NarL family, nitrate/nitrite response regulator NarL
MKIPPEAAQPPPPLRVRIVAADPLRRLGLETIVTQAGHRLDDAGDVVLADGDVEAADDQPVLALGAEEAGQAGRLPRDAMPAQIDAALRAVAAGLIVRSEEPPRRTFGSAEEAAVPLLSPREVEVLALIGDGLSNKQVARRLGISGHTVKFHIESLFRKLAAGSRAEAVHKGLRRGLIEL